MDITIKKKKSLWFQAISQPLSLGSKEALVKTNGFSIRHKEDKSQGFLCVVQGVATFFTL